MTIYFITDNKGKLAEAQAIIPSIEQLDIDLPELQDIDATAIIKAKLAEAFNHYAGPLMVEDTSVYFDALNGMPGPLIKWFLKTLGNEGLYNLAEKLGNNKAQAKVLIGYAPDKDNVQFFEGVIEGEIVAPKGEGFGWDPIFKPNGYDKTFGEMNAEEKNAISMRRLALDKLKAVL